MCGTLVKILRYTVFQYLGLADVDDLPCAVMHDIHTGGKRQLIGLFTQACQPLFICRQGIRGWDVFSFDVRDVHPLKKQKERPAHTTDKRQIRA